jgi:uncharacterized protein (DUF885 family)
MIGVHPVQNRRDVENYTARLYDAPRLFDSSIKEAQSRAARGFQPPRFILTATIEQVDNLLKGGAERSVLVTTLDERMAKVASITAEDRAQLHGAAVKAVAESVNPAFERVGSMLRDQVKCATDDAGIWHMPDGLSAYMLRLRGATTTDYSPDRVQQIGLEQVARIEKEMDGVLRKLGYTDGPVMDRYRKVNEEQAYAPAPDVRDRVLADYDRILRDAERRASGLFDLRPKAEIVVRRVPEFREKQTGPAYYFPPAKDGSTPGTSFCAQTTAMTNPTAQTMRLKAIDRLYSK